MCDTMWNYVYAIFCIRRVIQERIIKMRDSIALRLGKWIEG